MQQQKQSSDAQDSAAPPPPQQNTTNAAAQKNQNESQATPLIQDIDVSSQYHPFSRRDGDSAKNADASARLRVNYGTPEGESVVRQRASATGAYGEEEADNGETANLLPAHANLAPSESLSDVKISYDSVISDIGVGWYQYRFFIILAILGITEGSQITVFTLTLPILKAEWGLEDYLNSMQASFVFAGTLIGALLSGQFSDRFGRRRPFLHAVFFASVMSMLVAVSTNIYEMLVLRLAIGCLLGFFGPLSVTNITELTPTKVRGRYMGVLQVSLALGQLFGLLVGYLTLDGGKDGNWRMLVFWTVCPGFVAWVACLLYLDESPMFLLSQNRYDEAFVVLEKINALNACGVLPNPIPQSVRQGLQRWAEGGATHADHSEASHEPKTKAASVLSLLQGQYQGVTLILWVNCFALCFMYYGIIILLPYMLADVGNTNGSVYGDEDLIKLAISTLSEVVASALAAALIDIKGFGRKNSMIIFFAFEAVSCWIALVDDKAHFVLWTLVAKSFLTMTYIFTYQYTAEIYPTKVRTTGIGMSQAVGRLGGVFMPWVCITLMERNVFAPIFLFMCISVAMSILDVFLPYDTLGRELQA